MNGSPFMRKIPNTVCKGLATLKAFLGSGVVSQPLDLNLTENLWRKLKVHTTLKHANLVKTFDLCH